MRVRKLFTFLLFACAATSLHAGFVGTTCIDFGACFNTNTSTQVNQGSTTYTFLDTFTGGLVGGKPTLGTLAMLTVDNPNGVPILGITLPSSASMEFTDTIAVAVPQAMYSFNFNLHVNNSLNYFPQGFHQVFSQLVVNVFGRDQFGSILWATSNLTFPFTTVSTVGSTNTPVTYTVPTGFYNPLLASMDLSVTLSSTVYYSNYFPQTTATHVSAFSDASQTLTLQSVEAKDAGGTPTGDLLVSASGANYSTQSLSATPEPGSWGLALCGALSLLAWHRRK